MKIYYVCISERLPLVAITVTKNNGALEKILFFFFLMNGRRPSEVIQDGQSIMTSLSYASFTMVRTRFSFLASSLVFQMVVNISIVFIFSQRKEKRKEGKNSAGHLTEHFLKEL